MIFLSILLNFLLLISFIERNKKIITMNGVDADGADERAVYLLI